MRERNEPQHRQLGKLSASRGKRVHNPSIKHCDPGEAFVSRRGHLRKPASPQTQRPPCHPSPTAGHNPPLLLLCHAHFTPGQKQKTAAHLARPAGPAATMSGTLTSGPSSCLPGEPPRLLSSGKGTNLSFCLIPWGTPCGKTALKPVDGCRFRLLACSDEVRAPAGCAGGLGLSL